MEDGEIEEFIEESVEDESGGESKKFAFLVRITSEERKMLECLQQLFSLADVKLSMSRMIGYIIASMYRMFFFSQKKAGWEALVKLFKISGAGSMMYHFMGDVLATVRGKKHAVREILSVKVDLETTRWFGVKGSSKKKRGE